MFSVHRIHSSLPKYTPPTQNIPTFHNYAYRIPPPKIYSLPSNYMRLHFNIPLPPRIQPIFHSSLWHPVSQNLSSHMKSMLLSSHNAPIFQYAKVEGSYHDSVRLPEYTPPSSVTLPSSSGKILEVLIITVAYRINSVLQNNPFSKNAHCSKIIIPTELNSSQYPRIFSEIYKPFSTTIIICYVSNCHNILITQLCSVASSRKL